MGFDRNFPVFDYDFVSVACTRDPGRGWVAYASSATGDVNLPDADFP